MMIILTMTAILIGALLGLRFKVFILVPATVIGLAITLAVGIAYSESLRVQSARYGSGNSSSANRLSSGDSRRGHARKQGHI